MVDLCRIKTETMWSLWFLLFAGICAGKRILVLAPWMSGQLSEASGICDALIENGHEVYVVTEEHAKYPKQLKHVFGLKYLHFRSPDRKILAAETMDNELSKSIFGDADHDSLLTNLAELTSYFGESLLNDTDLMKTVKELNFDFALFDSFIPFLGIIPYVADIKYASWSPFLTPFRMNLPLLTGFEPCNLRGDRNTFFNRLKHVHRTMRFNFMSFQMTPEGKYLKWIRNNYPSRALKRSISEVISNSAFFILSTSNLLDCPAPSKPNIVYAGGLSVHPSKPLSGKFEEIVDSANDGIIVFTLGSMVSQMPNNVLEKFIVAFKEVKQIVLWRLTLTGLHKNIAIPSNVHIVDWLPQNDLLGNPKTRIFITHAGANSQAEAIYHGVPVVCFPLLDNDQAYNSKKFASRGFGLELKIRTFEPDELLAAVNEILTNRKYKNNIMKSSKIFKSSGPSSKRVAEMIEHVLEFGEEHLKTAGDQMEWYQFYMIDVFLFVFVTGFTCLYMSYRIAKSISRYCLCSKKKTQTN